MALDKLTQVTTSGITSTSPLSSLTISGAITGGDATFDSVDVNGVLTYDDVTNIDALGIVTARSGIHVTGGSVGIGTDNPDKKLVVKGTGGNFVSEFHNTQDAVNNNGVYIRTENIDAATNTLNVQGSLIVNGAGNVGINETVPEQKLDVVGSAHTVAVFRPDTNSVSAYGDASVVNNLVNLRMPYGSNPGSSPNSGARWGIKFQGRNDGAEYGTDAGKSASIYAVSEDATAGYNRQVGLTFYTSGFDVNQTERLRITSDGDIKFGTQGSSVANSSTALTHIDAGREYWNGTAGDYRALKHRLYYASTDDAYGMGISPNLLEIQSQTNIAFFSGSAGVASGRRVERLRITSEGEVLIGTTAANSFNGVGQAHNLIVAGSTSDTDITDNSSAAITISNTDGTADNTAGLHFAREDTDGNPHYTGASIVSQFKEAQVTGQYPKADLAFLTSTSANNAPSEKMRIYASGAVTTPSNPLLKVNSTTTYGAFQSLHVSPNVSIAQAAAQINVGDTGWTTSGGNAYTFVCPVTGVYALHAHISLGNITQGNRVIWSMAYTLGGGNLPLSNYVEVIDTNVSDYENASYFDTWYFTAGTRVGMGINSSTGGSIAGLALSWGMYLLQ